MIGVASRKAKRAASLCESPTRRPPAIAAPEREKTGNEGKRLRRADEERGAPATVRAIRASSSSSVTGARRRIRSARKSSSPFTSGRSPPSVG